MFLDVKRIEKDEWYAMAGSAHEIVFQETWSADKERIDYTLLTVDPKNVLVQYATIKEVDSESAYIQYGGSFPHYKGTATALHSFKAMLDYLFKRYKRVSFLTQNKNFPMLKFAIHEKFYIVGARMFNGGLYLEHLREREL